MGEIAWTPIDEGGGQSGTPRSVWTPWRGIVFIGFMGAGKSTAASALAQRMGGCTAIDSDARIEAHLGRTIAEDFAARGEAAFRETEERVALELLEGAPPGAAISLGGGSVLSERVREALASYLVVLLDIDPGTAWERVRGISPATSRGGSGEGAAQEASGDGEGQDGDVSKRGAGREERPLARDWETFRALHGERAPTYERLADAILPATVPGVAVKALRGLRALQSAPVGTRMLWASSQSGEYPVLVGRGLIARGLLGSDAPAADAWPLDRRRSRPFCVSDTTVSSIYGGALGDLASMITFPAGEAQKTVRTAEMVWNGLLAAEMSKGDHVVALGGGVVGDIAGFCAATYQRGVPYVQVPTTLVSQVDSAYGGKTGVDLPEGKNYVGAYHQPAGVIVDPDTLESLPEREIAAGWVEVAKTALIAGGDLWERVDRDEPVDERTIVACARAKLEVVARDERDGGARQALNLGHTIGHAIETATDYGRYLHGEAVGLGLLAALRLSGRHDLRKRLTELMASRGLPTSMSGVPVRDVVAATRRDKKRVGRHVPFVLVKAPGDVEIGQRVPSIELYAAVAELSE